MKILAMVPVWKRANILSLFLSRLRCNLPVYAKMDFVFIVSPEDPEVEIIRKTLNGEDVYYFKNEPLGEKMNAGITYILGMEFDYLMNIGSDNIWTGLLWELYQPYFTRQCLFFGINDFHAIDFLTGETKLIRRYNTGMDDKPAPIGAGRMIHKSIIPDKLYRDEFMWGMDGASAFTLYQAGHLPEVVETNGRPVMLNIMSRTNLTQWEEIDGEPCNRFEVRNRFGLDHYRVIEVGADIEIFNANVCRYTAECGSRRAAFERVNAEYRYLTGEFRFKNYDSFKTAIYKKSKQ